MNKEELKRKLATIEEERNKKVVKSTYKCAKCKDTGIFKHPWGFDYPCPKCKTKEYHERLQKRK